MSKEAMKLACKALRDCHYYIINAGLPNQSLLNEAFTAYMELEAALATQLAQQEIDWKDQYEKQKRRADMWVAKYEADIGPLEKAGPVTAQQEPVAVVSGYYGGQCVILPTDPARIFNSNTALYTSPPPQRKEPEQEPVTYWDLSENEMPVRPSSYDTEEHPNHVPLYTTPPPCPTCEALARTVMLDQTSHDTHRKPTDEMVVAAARVLSDRQAAACNVDFGDMWKLHGNDFIEDARAALEAANSIREKNT